MLHTNLVAKGSLKKVEILFWCRFLNKIETSAVEKKTKYIFFTSAFIMLYMRLSEKPFQVRNSSSGLLSS